MHASTLLLALLPSLVHSWWPLERRLSVPVCLTPQQGQTVANNYAKLFTSYSNSYANSVLTSSFADQSDSVAWLINNGTNCPVPFGSVTFPTLASFEAGSGSQPDIPFQVLNVWVSCSYVTVRWVSAQKPEQVQGIAVLSTVFNPSAQNQFQISHIYSEFNSGAFGVNVGVVNKNAGTLPCPA